MIEADLIADIRLLSRGAVRLFRNNVGLAVDAHGNFTSYGLAVGSSDLIGWRTRVIMPVDVGCEWAVFCAIEAKSKRGIVSKEQAAFIETVKRAGGLAGIARSLDDAKRILHC